MYRVRAIRAPRLTGPLVDSVGIQRVQSRIPSSMNPFHYHDRVIVSIDTLKKDAAEGEKIVATLRAWLEAGTAPAEVCIASRTLKQLKSRYQPLLEAEGIATVLIEKDADAGLPGDRVRLASMHRMKGLEFPKVLLAGVQRGDVPLRFRGGSDAAERAEHDLKERCLFYVACTRARDELVVTGFGERSGFLGG